jgi:hypothetical protein
MHQDLDPSPFSPFIIATTSTSRSTIPLTKQRTKKKETKTNTENKQHCSFLHPPAQELTTNITV